MTKPLFTLITLLVTSHAHAYIHHCGTTTDQHGVLQLGEIPFRAPLHSPTSCTGNTPTDECLGPKNRGVKYHWVSTSTAPHTGNRLIEKTLHLKDATPSTITPLNVTSQDTLHSVLQKLAPLFRKPHKLNGWFLRWHDGKPTLRSRCLSNQHGIPYNLKFNFNTDLRLESITAFYRWPIEKEYDLYCDFVHDDKPNRLQLGQHAFNHYSPKNCNEQDQSGCNQIDKGNVAHYWSWEVDGEGFPAVLLQKELKMKQANRHSRTPLGLQANDTLATLLQKLHRHHQNNTDTLTWYLDRSKGYDRDRANKDNKPDWYFATEYCISNKYQGQYGLSIEFENDHVAEIEARIHWP